MIGAKHGTETADSCTSLRIVTEGRKNMSIRQLVIKVILLPPALMVDWLAFLLFLDGRWDAIKAMNPFKFLF